MLQAMTHGGGPGTYHSGVTMVSGQLAGSWSECQQAASWGAVKRMGG